MRKIAYLCCAALLLLGFSTLVAAPTVDPAFEYTLLVTDLVQPKGIDSAHRQAGAGPMGDYLYVAESGMNRIVRFDPDGNDLSVHAPTIGQFPVGVNCYGGPFAQYMYVGCAFSGGIERIDVNGNTAPFALLMLDIAGIDFGKGQFGEFMYAGEWTAGNIWKVDTLGNAVLFTTLPAGSQSRYLRFGAGGAFGHDLYVTDFMSGKIFRIDSSGLVTQFADTGALGLEGLEFSSGGAFGRYLYTGNILTGDLYRVDSDGTVMVWASGFAGVADITFVPGGRGGFSMYFVDGHDSVYKISKTK